MINYRQLANLIEILELKVWKSFHRHQLGFEVERSVFATHAAVPKKATLYTSKSAVAAVSTDITSKNELNNTIPNLFSQVVCLWLLANTAMPANTANIPDQL